MFVLVHTGWAESVFSIYGMGEVIHTAETRARGMGGVGLAVNHQYNLGFLNPALCSIQKRASFIGMYMPESRTIQDKKQKVNLTNANFPIFKLVIPTVYRLHFGVGLSQIIDANYMVTSEEVVPNTDVSYIDRVEGQGGLYKASISTARKVIGSLAFGAEFDYYFGKKEQSWIKEFDNPDYYNTEDMITNDMTGVGYSFGLLYQPFQKLSIGLVYNLKPQIHTDKTTSQLFGDESNWEEKEIELPSTYGVGLSYKIKKFTIASDIFITDWNEFTINENITTKFVNSTRFGLGFEYIYDEQSNISYWHKIPIRLGFYTNNWYYEFPIGTPIRENFITTGFGIPLDTKGFLDMAFEFGKRGNKNKNTLEEHIFRFSISLSGQEKWGNRRRRY